MEKQLPQLQPNELWPFEHISTRHDARVAQGVSPESLLDPAYWAHHAVKLRPMDEIRARAEDGTWIGYYVVLDCSRTWAKVQCIAFHNLSTRDVSVTQSSASEVALLMAAHSVIHRGPHRWSVVRNADKAVLLEGKQQKEDAVAWLEDYAKDQVGVPGKLPQEAVSEKAEA